MKNTLNFGSSSSSTHIVEIASLFFNSELRFILRYRKTTRKSLNRVDVAQNKKDGDANNVSLSTNFLVLANVATDQSASSECNDIRPSNTFVKEIKFRLEIVSRCAENERQAIVLHGSLNASQ